MALISCPECLKKISDNAEYCPSCGNPINPPKVYKPKGSGCFMQTLNTGCLIVVIIMIFAIVLAGISAYKFRSSKGAEKTELNSGKKK
jgi:hypothetical protein